MALPQASAADHQLISQLKGSAPGGGITQADAQAAQSKKAEEESMRQQLLQRVMAPDAKERLSRISLVKPDKARKLEDMVLHMAQRGQIGDAQLSDVQLKQMLEQISETGSGACEQPKVHIDRRRRFGGDDSDSDIDLDGL